MLLGACGLFNAEQPVASSRSTAEAAITTTKAAADPSAPVATAKPAPKAPLAQPVNFEQAVDRAGDKVFSDALERLGSEQRTVVIDPLIDANTGAQTASTVLMGDQLKTMLKKSFPTWEVQPFTRDALATKPLLVIGTLTPVNNKGDADLAPDAFRIWLTLIDLRTGRVVSKHVNRATMETVDLRPLKFYGDSPSWTKDRTVAGYINSCQINTNVGDLADPIYLEHLPASALVNEAIVAYGAGNLVEARNLYREARTLADPGDLRVSNGLYLTNWRLGDLSAAKDAFDGIVAFGLETGRLPLKFLFRTGSTGFSQIGDWPEQYRIWLASLAQQGSKFESCMTVVGHSSGTGDPDANQVLSQRRAKTVEHLLQRNNRDLTPRLSAIGMGSKEMLVGVGTDDLRDALDRRVEFRVVECAGIWRTAPAPKPGR
ncbi:MAG: OmpA family protein [Rhodospirillales bacterium]